ncbi:hypothetical protein IAU60_000161 [Kwoniella sp. DSM 27419]
MQGGQIPLPVPQPITAGPVAASPSLIPGPFILLLLLPSIPLILFSLGARPPDTSHLPFSTTDVFATGAFVTVAGTVVLCFWVYPEAGGMVWSWIRDGRLDVEGWQMPWSGLGGWGWGSGTQFDVVRSDGAARLAGVVSSSERRFIPPRLQWQYDERSGRWRRLATSTSIKVNSIKGIRPLPATHLTALRTAFPTMYSTNKPPLIPAIMGIAFAIFLLTLAIGAVLRRSYEGDRASSRSSRASEPSRRGSSKMPSWVERELRKRKEEKPADTEKRVKNEEKKEYEAAKKEGRDELDKFLKRREKEKRTLVKELEKRKMPAAGLRAEPGRYEDGKGKLKKEGADSKRGSDEGKVSTGHRLHRILAGRRAKLKPEESATRGPGWEAADPAVAQVTLAQSGANAQRMAEKLKAGGSG